jgi:hypothetical protein
MDHAVEMLLDIEGEPGSDRDDLATLAQLLGEELRQQLDVAGIEAVAGGAAPSGAKGIDATLVGQLIVKLGPVAVGAVLRAVAGWLNRVRARRVAVRIGPDEIILDRATPEQQERALTLFAVAHGG